MLLSVVTHQKEQKHTNKLLNSSYLLVGIKLLYNPRGIGGSSGSNLTAKNLTLKQPHLKAMRMITHNYAPLSFPPFAAVNTPSVPNCSTFLGLRAFCTSKIGPFFLLNEIFKLVQKFVLIHYFCLQNARLPKKVKQIGMEGVTFLFTSQRFIGRLVFCHWKTRSLTGLLSVMIKDLIPSD